MLEIIDKKLRQMHAALKAISTEDLSEFKPQIDRSSSYISMKVDFNENSDPIELANAASLLIANIASLKDHLKVWCKSKELLFKGDLLIDSNIAVALIHDLWNVDKHAELTSKPRSGVQPILKDIHRSLVMTAGTEVGSGVMYSIDPRTGKVTTSSSGSGQIKVAINAIVADAQGNVLGEFSALCEEAVDAWQKGFASVGIHIN